MADFVRVCKELHDQLVAAGMVATTDTGQLDFTTMAAQPLTASTIYGYRMYRLDDGNALPVYLKIRFGCGAGAMSANRQAWYLLVSIGLGTNGSGTLSQSTAEYVVGTNGTYQNVDSTKINTALTSLICCKAGFLGVSWKQQIVAGNASYGPSATDNLPIGSFFICRDTNDSGDVTADGVSLVAIAPGGTLYSDYGAVPAIAHLSSAGTLLVTRRGSIAMGADTQITVGGSLPLFFMYAMTPTPRRIAQLLVVAKAPSTNSNEEFDARSVGTATRHFMAMNTVLPADVWAGVGSKAAIAMLWED